MVFTLGSFVLVTVAVAFVSWLKTKGTDETSKDGYFLGGRSLSGLVIFGSLMMTNLSAEQLHPQCFTILKISASDRYPKQSIPHAIIYCQEKYGYLSCRFLNFLTGAYISIDF